MAKTTQIRNVVLLCIVFLSVLVRGCGHGLAWQPKISDEEMIHRAKTYQTLFTINGILRMQIRQDYYIFSFGIDANDLKNQSLYMVSTDCKIIRYISNNMEIISTDANNDSLLPNNLRVLLPIVDDAYKHQVGYVSVRGDTITLMRFDRYYITNKYPLDPTGLTEIQPGWYISKPK